VYKNSETEISNKQLFYKSQNQRIQSMF